MKAREFREMTDHELHNMLADMYRELFNLRFQLATKQLPNYRRIRMVKKDIARIKTVLRERQLAAERGRYERQEKD